jgi:hypothetical protein
MALYVLDRWNQDQRFLFFLIGSGGSRIRIGMTMQLAGRPLRIASLLVTTQPVPEVLPLLGNTLIFSVRDNRGSAIFLLLWVVVFG